MNRVALFGILLLSAAATAADPKTEARDALWAAVRAGDEKAVAAALDKGADVNAKNEYGVSAIWIACNKGKKEVIEVLLKRGADPNSRDGIWYQTPLSHSISRPDNVKLLVAAGAKDIDAALVTAATRGLNTVAPILLASGKASQEALDAALLGASESNKEMREALTKAGAKPLPVLPEKDREPLKPFVGSFESEHGGVMKIELKDIGLTNGAGRTAYRLTGPNTLVPFGGEETSITFERTGEKVSRVVVKRFTAEAIYFPAGSKPAPKAGSAPKDIAVGDVKPANWPQFRGAAASGVADGQNPPLTFDVPEKKNLLWKSPIPGLGHSCPVIWGDRIFLTTAVGGNTDLKTGNYGDPASVKDKADEKVKFQVICLNRLTGEILWTKTAFEGAPKIKRHLKGSHANCTAATDGTRVVVCFGSEGLYCYDFDGKQLWARDLGTLDSSFALEQQYEWGFAASPILFEDRVILQCDLSRDSFLAAYSLSDGSPLWSTPRDEIPSWSSPTIWKNSKRTEIVTNASQYARGYDPFTGKELWRFAKKSEATVPTPILLGDLAFVTSGNRPIQPIAAIRAGATGDISLKPNEEKNSHVAWGKLRGGPYMPTPILYGKHLFTCGNSGMVTCYEAATGKELFKERLGGATYTASPVAADGRIYFVSEEGEARVIKAAPEFELLAVNKVGEICMSTPAICGGVLYIRTKDSLVAVGRK